MWKHRTLITGLLLRTADRFQSFADTNSAAVHASFYIFASISLGWILGSRIAASKSKCLCNSTDIVNTLNRADSILHHHLQCTGGLVLPPNLVYKSLDYSQHDRGKMLSRCYFFLLIFILYWTVGDLQCCVSFRCASVF